MPDGLRRRFWVESAVGGLTAFLTALTLISREWIEAIFGVDPDHGNGSAEWLAVVVCAVVTIVMGVTARREWRRAQPAT